jgi:hypothetical protein
MPRSPFLKRRTQTRSTRATRRSQAWKLSTGKTKPISPPSKRQDEANLENTRREKRSRSLLQAKDKTKPTSGNNSFPRSSVGMPSSTLRVDRVGTQSVPDGIPTEDRGNESWCAGTVLNIAATGCPRTAFLDGIFPDSFPGKAIDRLAALSASLDDARVQNFEPSNKP